MEQLVQVVTLIELPCTVITEYGMREVRFNHDLVQRYRKRMLRRVARADGLDHTFASMALDVADKVLDRMAQQKEAKLMFWDRLQVFGR